MPESHLPVDGVFHPNRSVRQLISLSGDWLLVGFVHGTLKT